MHMSAGEVDVRRFFRLGDGVLTGQHQSVETHGTLGPARVDLGDAVLQLTLTLRGEEKNY